MNSVIKIEYHEFIPNWEKYELDFPNDTSETIDEISHQIEYSDTTYIIYMTSPVQMKTYSNSTLVSTDPNYIIIDRLLECGELMMLELRGQN
ncbi:MAG: hypothetical protein HYZ14_09255 [Bacteroidetes bacterium]|nr:hypothetical protein [Bacteroidota bacterium]